MIAPSRLSEQIVIGGLVTRVLSELCAVPKDPNSRI
jgi:hypothetical protein